MKLKKNSRGFAYGEFIDRYQQKCSLQKSSLAMEDAIWLGVDNTGPQIKGPGGNENEDIWARMHLTQAMVKRLLPTLILFVQTGELSSCGSPMPGIRCFQCFQKNFKKIRRKK